MAAAATRRPSATKIGSGDVMAIGPGGENQLDCL